MNEDPESSPAPTTLGGARGVPWLSGPALRLHATAIVGVAVCLVAADLEWSRALGGHELAWVYSFEWPILAVMGVYLWWKLLLTLAPGTSTTRPAPAPSAVGDPELEAWQAYLRRLHAIDPPGGPT